MEKGFLNYLHSTKFNNMFYKSTHTKKMGSIRIMKKVCCCDVLLHLMLYSTYEGKIANCMN